MNSALLREKNPHGDAAFPLEVHELETDVRSGLELSCHWHEELEFFVVTKGEARFTIDAGSFRVSAGELVFVNSNRLHSAVSIGEEPFGFFAVVFSPDLLRSYGNDRIQQEYINPVLNSQISFPEHIGPRAEWGKHIFSALSEIRTLYRGKDASYELRIKINLYEIWDLLYSCSSGAARMPAGNSDYRVARIKSMLEYIQKRCGGKITLAELSREFSVSEGQLCRFFKSMVKMSVMSYVNYCRINASAALLEKTDREIGEIACMVGFNNISYFNRTFRKYMHQSPSRFRQRKRE